MSLQAKKFGTHIDLTQNEVRNAVVQVLSSAPSSPVQGQTYYDSTLNRVRYYTGSAWINEADRANHTGTQLASTISDFDSQVRTSRLDQMAAPTASVALNAQRITGLADPTGAQDAATKNYVDNAVAGLSWKDEVVAATTANGTLATAFANGQTIDGVTLVTGDRILIKNQTTGSENGIYVVAASGAPSRATDADTSAELIGAALYVKSGTTNGGSRFINTNTGSITIGTTAVTFTTFGGGGTYSAGNGITLTGSTFSVTADTGISVSGSGVAIDHSVVPKIVSFNLGDNSSTTFTLNHNLGTRDVIVQIYKNSSSYEQVEFDVQRTDANNVTVNVNGFVPGTNAYRVVIHG